MLSPEMLLGAPNAPETEEASHREVAKPRGLKTFKNTQIHIFTLNSLKTIFFFTFFAFSPMPVAA